MQTKNLIQAAANVVKITRLSKGDVIKLIETGYSSPEVFFGVVIDLLNDGENAFVQVLRYKKSYGAIDCDIKTYAGDKDINVFPATVEEIEDHLNDSIKSIEKDILKKERELSDQKLGLQKAKEFVSMELSKSLQSASFKEISQQEYLQLQEAKTF